MRFGRDTFENRLFAETRVNIAVIACKAAPKSLRQGLRMASRQNEAQLLASRLVLVARLAEHSRSSLSDCAGAAA